MNEKSTDTRVTDYVFGELAESELAAFEQELQDSESLQAEVAELRQAIAAVESELSKETIGLDDASRDKVQQVIDSPMAVRNHQASSSNRTLWIASAVAASLLLLAGVGLMLPAVQFAREASSRKNYSDLESVQGSAVTHPNDMGDLSVVTSDPQEESLTEFSMEAILESDAPAQSEAEPPLRYSAAETSERLKRSNLTQHGSVEDPLSSPPTVGSPVPEPSASVDRLATLTKGVEGDTQELVEAPATRPATSLSSELSLPIENQREEAFMRDPSKVESLGGTSRKKYRESPGSTLGKDGQNRAESISRGGRVSPGQPHEMLSTRTAPSPGNESKKPRPFAEAFIPNFGLMDDGLDVANGLGPGKGGDRHDPIEDNPFRKVTANPLSTFSIDVDTASYAKVRMYLMQQNRLPRPDAVRIEELVNYFTYDYQSPAADDPHPFSAAMEVAECPWNPQHRLARIGIQGKAIETDRPASNLVFLLDVSGSMNQPKKLPLVVEGMKMLVDQLTENDSVAIVVYAGAAGVVLDATTGDKKQTIIESLERLRAGGSTNGGQGIQLAYSLARDHFIAGGTNRVILCSDGDFNVGVTGTDELVRIAQENAKGNIFLTVLGFGMGNHNDAMMEQISNKGNGNYAFIDSKSEARKVLVDQIGSTLVTIAKDVKIQIEFNPHEVAAYRLIGYENRILAAQDFNDDKKDAGEIGAGHSVTALYELVPADGESDVTVPPIDDLRYQKQAKPNKHAGSGELLTLKLRYKQPEGTKSTLMVLPIKDEGNTFVDADRDFRFAASVAAFGMLLRNSPHKGNATFANVKEIATQAVTKDKAGYRTEFLQMVDRAAAIAGE